MSSLELKQVFNSVGGQALFLLSVWRETSFDLIAYEFDTGTVTKRRQNIYLGNGLVASGGSDKEALLAAREAVVELKTPLTWFKEKENVRDDALEANLHLVINFEWHGQDMSIRLPPSPEPHNDIALYMRVSTRSVNELKELLVQRSRQLQAATSWMLNTAMLLRQSAVTRQEIESDLYEGVLSIINGRTAPNDDADHGMADQAAAAAQDSGGVGDGMAAQQQPGSQASGPRDAFSGSDRDMGPGVSEQGGHESDNIDDEDEEAP